MDFHYTYSVKASADKLWTVVSDVPTVGLCIPGATDVTQSEDGSYIGTVKVRIGPVSLGLAGKLAIQEIDAAARTISLTGEGADRRVPGNVGVKIRMAVSAVDADTSELVVDTQANVMGKLGEFGQGLIRRKADGMMKSFGENLSKRVEEG